MKVFGSSNHRFASRSSSGTVSSRQRDSSFRVASSCSSWALDVVVAGIVRVDESREGNGVELEVEAMIASVAEGLQSDNAVRVSAINSFLLLASRAGAALENGDLCVVVRRRFLVGEDCTSGVSGGRTVLARSRP